MDAWRTSSSSIFAAVAAGSSTIPALFTGRDLLHSVGGGLAWVVTGIGSVAMARGIRRLRRFFRCFNEPTLQVLYIALFLHNCLILCRLHKLASTRNEAAYQSRATNKAQHHKCANVCTLPSLVSTSKSMARRDYGVGRGLALRDCVRIIQGTRR